MGNVHECLSPELQDWIAAQRLFFVATAPRSDDGWINCSPRGMDTFRVLGPDSVAWLDLTGSGVETIAHLRENGRIVIMFCAFEGAPRILRLHGQGEALVAGSSEFGQLRPLFPGLPGARAIIRVRLRRISDSCGYGVPKMVFEADRETLVRWAENKGPDGLEEYRRSKNARSLDGLPGLEAAED